MTAGGLSIDRADVLRLRPTIGRALAWLAIDRVLLVAFAGSRLIVLIAAVVAETLIPRNAALTSSDAAPILRSLTSWDGLYYLGIARDGYHAAPLPDGHLDVAFPPLYPFLVRVLAAPWPAWAGLVSVVLSNVLLLVGLALLARLGAPYLGRRRARLAAVYLAFFPFAAVFSMAYTESLFLVLVVGAFLAADRGRHATTGVLLALATLTRLQGVALLLPLGILLWQRGGRRLDPGLGWLALGPAAAGGFLALAASVTGSSTAYLDAQSSWGRSGLGGATAGMSLLDRLGPYNASLFLVLLVGLFALVYLRVDRVPIAFSLVPILFLGLELSSGLLEAVGRILMLAFPYAWILARRGPTFRAAWLPTSAALLGIVSLLMFGGYYVP